MHSRFFHPLFSPKSICWSTNFIDDGRIQYAQMLLAYKDTNTNMDFNRGKQEHDRNKHLSVIQSRLKQKLRLSMASKLYFSHFGQIFLTFSMQRL